MTIMPEKHFNDKEEVELIISFQELVSQFEKLQAIDLSNLSELIFDTIVYPRYDIDFIGLTNFLEKYFEHIKEFVRFIDKVVNIYKQNPSHSLLNILDEVFKETWDDLKWKGFFRSYTQKYIQGETEFGVMHIAYIPALGIDDIIKNLRSEKIDLTRVAYNSKKSAGSLKKFVDFFVDSITNRKFNLFI